MFKSENAFRDKVICPLLSELGYILPTRDGMETRRTYDQQDGFLLFAHIDPFRYVSIHAAIVVLGDVSPGKVEDDVFNRLDRAFKVKWRASHGIDFWSIASASVMASGRISPTVIESLKGRTSKKGRQRDVRFESGAVLRRIRSDAAARRTPEQITLYDESTPIGVRRTGPPRLTVSRWNIGG